jgi:deoxyribonuclease V
MGRIASVIGVAKNPLKIAGRFVPVFRGRSRKPLFVSAIGHPVEKASLQIESMHGVYRIPTLLKLADQYARTVQPL